MMTDGEELREADVNPRVEGMADAHECVMVAYRKALDALDFMWEVENQSTSFPKPTVTNAEKLSYAHSVLTVMMEAFDDEYYRVIEQVKDVEV
jgi:hypothetical protein